MKKFFLSLSIFLFITPSLLSIPERLSEDRFLMQIGIENLDQDLAVLRTRYFYTTVTLFERKPTRIYLFYRDPNKQPDYLGGDSVFRGDLMAEVWNRSIVTLPEKGAHLWDWPLVVTGEFPNERYSLIFIVGLNTTAAFGTTTISPELPDAFKGDWSVTTELSPISPSTDQLSVAQIDFSRFKYEIDNCVDFYRVSVVFSRTGAQTWRFNVYWYIAAGLFATLAVAFLFFRRLNLGEIIALSVGILGFTAGRWVSLTNDLVFPRTRRQLIESSYVGILLLTMVWLIAAIFLKTRSREKRGFPPIDASLWQAIDLPGGHQRASLPRVGTLFINHGESLLKLKVVATVFLGSEQIDGVTGDVHGYYSGRTPIEMLPKWKFWGNFGIQDRCVASPEILRVQLDIQAADEQGKKYKPLYHCYTYDRKKNGWFLEPTRCKDLIKKEKRALLE